MPLILTATMGLLDPQAEAAREHETRVHRRTDLSYSSSGNRKCLCGQHLQIRAPDGQPSWTRVDGFLVSYNFVLPSLGRPRGQLRGVVPPAVHRRTNANTDDPCQLR